VSNELKTRISVQMFDILFGPCKKVVRADYIISISKKSINQMGAQKSRSTGNQNSLLIVVNPSQVQHSTDWYVASSYIH
jgi:hypothetical protein